MLVLLVPTLPRKDLLEPHVQFKAHLVSLRSISKHNDVFSSRMCSDEAVQSVCMAAR